MDRAGVTIADHHTESERFLKFLDAMVRKGKAVPTDWSWVVAPMSASTLPTFHRYYDDFETSPSFSAQPTLFDPGQAHRYEVSGGHAPSAPPAPPAPPACGISAGGA